MDRPVQVLVDMGSSQTRVVWLLNKYCVLYRHFLASCSLASASQSPESMGSDSYYVECGKASYVVGSRAVESPIAADAVDALKVEASIYRILAALHLVFEHYAREGESPSIALTLLLPSNEHRSFALLERTLHKSLKSFRCNGEAYELTLDSLDCFVEGFGVLKYSTHEDSGYASEKVLTAMVGYRDISFIASIGHQEILQAKTARLGLLWLLKDIEDQVGDIDRLKAARLLFELGSGSITAGAVRELTRVRSEAMKSQDAVLIAKAMRASRKKYWDFIERAFKSLPFEYEMLLVCGGTGEYLKEHLCNVLPGYVATPESLIERIVENSDLDYAEAARFADIFGLAYSMQMDMPELVNPMLSSYLASWKAT
ncbi:MAG: hypothetical protein AAGA40_12260 [Cyanobacteria bacterium P01_E01_bin.45]